MAKPTELKCVIYHDNAITHHLNREATPHKLVPRDYFKEEYLQVLTDSSIPVQFQSILVYDFINTNIRFHQYWFTISSLPVNDFRIPVKVHYQRFEIERKY